MYTAVEYVYVTNRNELEGLWSCGYTISAAEPPNRQDLTPTAVPNKFHDFQESSHLTNLSPRTSPLTRSIRTPQSVDRPPQQPSEYG